MDKEIVLNKGAMSVEEVQQNVARMDAIRGVLNEYIERNLTAGTDYGKIHISKNCANKYELSKCELATHWSKSSLFKPGSEKMCNLFQIRPIFKMDQESREMAGNPTGVFFYLCELIGADGRVWGEGRGSCAAVQAGDDENKRTRDQNSAVKIAEKRAQVDAVIRAFALSDRFTQDIEDTEPSALDQFKQKPPLPGGPVMPQGAPKPPQQANSPKLSPAQAGMIKRLLAELGIAPEVGAAQIFAIFKKKTADLTKKEASNLIGRLVEKKVAKKNEGTPGPLERQLVHEDVQQSS